MTRGPDVGFLLTIKQTNNNKRIHIKLTFCPTAQKEK